MFKQPDKPVISINRNDPGVDERMIGSFPIVASVLRVDTRTPNLVESIQVRGQIDQHFADVGRFQKMVSEQRRGNEVNFLLKRR